jgi:Predicted Fe-S protein
MNHAYRTVLSPCIGICSLDDAGLCLGCRRSAAEIASWTRMDDDQRLQLIELLPSRAAGVVPERA